jgi:hypothetical protein
LTFNSLLLQRYANDQLYLPRDVPCSVWFGRKLSKLQAGKGLTESRLKCNIHSQELGTSEQLIY